MKKYCIIVLMLLPLCYLTANERFTSMFETYESSVVYIDLAYYLNADDLQNQEVISGYEDILGYAITDIYYTIKSGTGFFISNDGYILADKNVASRSYITFNTIITGILSTILYSDKNNNMTTEIYKGIKKELMQVVTLTNISYRVLVNNSDNYEATIVETDNTLNMALLKIDEINAKALPLGDSDSLKVGHEVMAIGYPLSVVENFLDEFRATMTKGSVSAVRNDTWGIQHTSPISVGDSGGPLFDIHGNVIGINTGEAEKGNELYFSIPINKIITWLQGTDSYKDVRGKIVAPDFSDTYERTIRMVEDEARNEIGESLFVDAETGYDIYINGKKAGQTPQLLKGLPAGDLLIEVKNDEVIAQQNFYVTKAITGVSTYKPEFNVYTGTVTLITTPDNAKVYKQGKYKGRTPLTLDTLELEPHDFTIKLDGYVSVVETITPLKNKPVTKEILLEKGYDVEFARKLPRDCSIEISNDRSTATYSTDETIMLATGEYTLRLTSEVFEENPVIMPFTISDDAVVLELDVTYKKSVIVFANLKNKSRVVVDGTEITGEIENGRYETTVGEHRVVVNTEDFRAFEDVIDLLPDEEYLFKVWYERSFERFKNSYKPYGTACLVPGITLIVPGVILGAVGLSRFYTAYSDTHMFSNYREYSSYIDATTVCFWAGVGLGITGLVLTAVSIPLFVIKKERSARKDTLALSFEVGGRSDFSCALTLRL